MEIMVSFFSDIFQMLDSLPVFNLGFSFLDMYFSILIIFAMCTFVRNILGLGVVSGVQSLGEAYKKGKVEKNQNKMEVAKDK